MIENKKVNLDCFITSQLCIAITRHRPLILAYIVTYIALYEGLIDLIHNDLHKACDLLPLDLISLNNMGLLCKNDTVFSLCPPVPSSFDQTMCLRKELYALPLLSLLRQWLILPLMHNKISKLSMPESIKWRVILKSSWSLLLPIWHA